jgi:hypothetical protein
LIKYLKNNEIDKQKWDACCTKAGNRFWFCKSWFIDLVCPGWHAIVSDNYEAIMALPIKRKYGISYLIQPFMMPQGGVISTVELSSLEINAFVQAIPSKYKYLNLCMNFSNKSFESSHIKSIRKNHYLSLNLPYNLLRKNYSERVRPNMKTAEKAGNIVVEFTDVSVFIQLYTKFSAWLTPTQRNSHINLVQKCIDNKTGHILLTQIGNKEITSGVFFFIDGKQIVIVIAFSTPTGKDTCSMNLLYDKIISLYAESNFEIDFTGSSMPGVALFLEGFGARPDTYPHIVIDNLPWFIRLLKKT